MAVKWLIKTVQHNKPKALFELGKLIISILDIQLDQQERLKFIEQSAKAGYPEAQQYLNIAKS